MLCRRCRRVLYALLCSNVIDVLFLLDPLPGAELVGPTTTAEYRKKRNTASLHLRAAKRTACCRLQPSSPHACSMAQQQAVVLPRHGSATHGRHYPQAAALPTAEGTVAVPVTRVTASSAAGQLAGQLPSSLLLPRPATGHHSAPAVETAAQGSSSAPAQQQTRQARRRVGQGCPTRQLQGVAGCVRGLVGCAQTRRQPLRRPAPLDPVAASLCAQGRRWATALAPQLAPLPRVSACRGRKGGTPHARVPGHSHQSPHKLRCSSHDVAVLLHQHIETIETRGK